MSHCNVRIMDENGRNLPNERLLSNWRERSMKKDMFRELAKSCFIVVHSALVRTDILRAVGGFNLDVQVQDWQIWLKIAKHHSIGFLDKTLVSYRTHGGGMSDNLLFNIEAQRKTLELFTGDVVIQKSLRRKYLEWFRILSKTPDKPLAKKYMRLAFARAWWSHKFWWSIVRTYLF